MGDIDYTEVRDEDLRGKICDLILEMLERKNGFADKFLWQMETLVLDKLDQQLKSIVCQKVLRRNIDD